MKNFMFTTLAVGLLISSCSDGDSVPTPLHDKSVKNVTVSNTVKQPTAVKTNDLKPINSGGRTGTSVLVGQWKFTTGYTYAYNQSVSSFDQSTQCRYGNVWINFVETGSNSGNGQIYNSDPNCNSVPFPSVYYDADAGGFLFELGPSGDFFNWSLNGNMLTLSRSKDGLSVTRTYEVDVNNTGSLIQIKQPQPNYRYLNFGRDSSGPF